MPSAPELQTTMPEFDLPHQIPADVRERLHNTLQLHGTVFHRGGQLRQTLAVQHDIQLSNPRPFREAPRRYPDQKKKFIDEQLREMLADGIVEPTTSPWSSAIMIATKQSGEYRFCIDFRRLNDQTMDTPQCLPRIHEILKDLGRAKIFTTLDLKSGYWQVPMAPEARQYTAFSAPDGGQYQFRVMPFGLKNAPGTFQDLMRHVLAGHWGRFCIAYLDDIIVYSESWDDHIHHVGLVLERLRTYGLTCSPEKCRFGEDTLPYLGHVVTSDGNQPQPRHVQAIQDAEPPKNRKALSSFLGVCNWLMEYIPRYSELTAPLTDLLSMKRPYKWTPEIQMAFEKLKDAFRSPTPLSRPDPDLTFILQTDASAIGMGAVLMQQDQEGKRRIISYASAKFQPVETRYHCNEQECLAVVWAITRYRPYLEDRRFVLRTDSRTLTWLDRMKDSNRKLTRWHVLLSGFKFHIEHCPGKENELPDALSRHPDPEEPSQGEPELERMVPPRRVSTTNPDTTPIPVLNAVQAPTLANEVAEAQQRDPIIGQMIAQYFEIRRRGPRSPKEEDLLHNNLLDERGLWRRDPKDGGWKLRVPAALRQRVIWEHHDVPLAGHPGSEETTRSIQEHFFWPGMTREIRRYVAGCHLCLCSKAVHGKRVDGQRPRATRTAWETVAVDIMGPYPLTTRGNRFILVVTDMFTRWIEAFPLRNSEAPTLIRTLEDEVFSRFGYPLRILSDNGKQFTSRTWAEASRRWNSELWTTPEYHPRANPTERRNQEVKKGLRLRLHDGNQRIWDQHLPSLLFGLRRRRNAATGYTPGYLMMGREIARPGEWDLRPVNDPHPKPAPLAEREEGARQRQEWYQRRYAGPAALPAFTVGDWVYALNHRQSNAAERFNAALAPIRTGPHPIVGAASADIFWVQKHDGAHKLHKKQLLPAPPPRDVTPAAPLQQPRPASEDHQEDEYPTMAAQASETDVLQQEMTDTSVAEQARVARHEEETPGHEVAEQSHLVWDEESEDDGLVAEEARSETYGAGRARGIAARDHQQPNSRSPSRETTKSTDVAEQAQPLNETRPLPPVHQDPADSLAVQGWNERHTCEQGDTCGRYDLRARQPVAYRDARPYAPRRGYLGGVFLD